MVEQRYKPDLQTRQQVEKALTLYENPPVNGRVVPLVGALTLAAVGVAAREIELQNWPALVLVLSFDDLERLTHPDFANFWDCPSRQTMIASGYRGSLMGMSVVSDPIRYWWKPRVMHSAVCGGPAFMGLQPPS